MLKSNADWLTAHANTHVQIEGHCDDRGSEEYNIALGARRAQAAKDYLTHPRHQRRPHVNDQLR